MLVVGLFFLDDSVIDKVGTLVTDSASSVLSLLYMFLNLELNVVKCLTILPEFVSSSVDLVVPPPFFSQHY